MNWKEQFDMKFVDWDFPKFLNSAATSKAMKAFISTEIIEKLIADIPDTFTTYDLETGNEIRYKAFQQQLRQRWLQ